MIDARRMEVFTAVYNKNFKKIKDVSALILKENSFDKILKEKFSKICHIYK